MAASLSLEEIAKHKTKTDLWVAVHEKVIDATKYLEDHPGGVDALIDVAGTDATSAFEDVGHSEDAREEMEHFCIGTLEGHVAPEPQHKSAPPPAPAPVQTPLPKFTVSSLSVPDITISDKLADRLLMFGIPAAELVVYHYLFGYHAGPVSNNGDDHASHPPVHHGAPSGFWAGFLASSAIGTFVLAACIMRLEKVLGSSPSISSFPTHMAPTDPSVLQVTHQRGVLDPKSYIKLALARKETISPNVIMFTFQLPMRSSILGLPIGQHIAIRGTVDGAQISRSYTPVSNNTDKGVLRLAIKIYQDGQLTGKYLQHLKIGDRVEFRGPKGTMRYRKGTFKHLGMIAGGTGITPMFQLIRAICEDPTDNTNISLIYANKNEDDILLRTMLEDWQRKNDKNFKLWYKLDTPPKNWQYGTKYVNADDIKERLPPPGPDIQILLCGPPGMVKGSQKNLETLGYDKASAVSKPTDMVFCF